MGAVFLPWPPMWPQFFTRPRGGLQPDVHFVAIKRDLSDLSERMQWCLDHRQACGEIAAAGYRYARKNLVYAAAVRYVSETLSSLGNYRYDQEEGQAPSRAVPAYARWVSEGHEGTIDTRPAGAIAGIGVT